MDGLTAPQYCGSLPEVLHAFTVRAPRIDLKRIIGNHLRIHADQLEPLQAFPVKGYRTLDPTGHAAEHAIEDG